MRPWFLIALLLAGCARTPPPPAMPAPAPDPAHRTDQSRIDAQAAAVLAEAARRARDGDLSTDRFLTALTLARRTDAAIARMHATGSAADRRRARAAAGRLRQFLAE